MRLQSDMYLPTTLYSSMPALIAVLVLALRRMPLKKKLGMIATVLFPVLFDAMYYAYLIWG